MRGRVDGERILVFDFMLAPPLWEMFERIRPDNKPWPFFALFNAPLWFDPRET